jgi:hypothetical protein
MTIRIQLFLALSIVVSTNAALAATDLSSPKSAAKSFYDAVAASDSAAIRDCLLAEGDQQQQLADAYVELIVASKKLGDAAKEKFGANGGKLSAETINKEDAARIDSATQTDKSPEEVQLTLDPVAKPLTFHRTSTGWKLIVMDSATAKPEAIEPQVKLLTTLTAAMNDTTDDIAAGKFPTSTDAESALRQRFSEVMVKAYKPASQPTTKAVGT